MKGPTHERSTFAHSSQTKVSGLAGLQDVFTNTPAVVSYFEAESAFIQKLDRQFVPPPSERMHCVWLHTRCDTPRPGQWGASP